jgi:hypothetical protein
MRATPLPPAGDDDPLDATLVFHEQANCRKGCAAADTGGGTGACGPVKVIRDVETGERIIKGNLDTEIVLDLPSRITGRCSLKRIALRVSGPATRIGPETERAGDSKTAGLFPRFLTPDS